MRIITNPQIPKKEKTECFFLRVIDGTNLNIIIVGDYRNNSVALSVTRSHPRLIFRGVYSKVNLKMLLVVLRSPCCRDDRFNPI